MLRTQKKMVAVGRAVTAVLLALAATLTLPATPAAAVEAGDDVWVGGRVGYGGTSIHPVYSPVPADPGNPGAAQLWSYCIEQRISVRTNAAGVAGDYSSYLGANLFTDPVVQAKVFWIITHSYPAVSLADLATAAGTTDLAPNDAIEGAQYAIWRFTDLGFDAAWPWETPASQAVYEYLVAGATADTAVAPPAPTSVDVVISAPPGAGSAGSLYGPFVVTTNQPTVSLSTDPAYPITDGSGAPIDPAAVVDGQAVYLDLRGQATAGSATITATAAGASGTGLIVSTPVVGSATATPASHAQSLILVAAAGATTSASAEAAWAAAAVPGIGTTLVDAADGDQSLAWNGGTLIDSVAYTGLTPGQEYTVSGELMRASDATGTSLIGSTTFTPAAADGTVEVRFTVPEGYAGQTLVAFEYLFEGGQATGTPIAEHTDIADAAQTVVVEAQPADPAIGTTLVDRADGDHVLAWNGGTVVDTVSYSGLTPGAEYTVTGELMRKSDGSGTGLVGSTTFSPAAATGSIEVTFTVPEGYAGQQLVAFEFVYAGRTPAQEPVAEHADLDDAAQTVSVEPRPASTGVTPPNGLASTGGALPGALAGGAALSFLAGTTLLLARRRARLRA